MMNFNGTPGKWSYLVMLGEVRNSEGKLLADMIVNGEEDENGRLIAAAPELLEALQLLMQEQSGGDKSCGHNGFTCTCPYDKARAAIAKALGQ